MGGGRGGEGAEKLNSNAEPVLLEELNVSFFWVIFLRFFYFFNFL